MPSGQRRIALVVRQRTLWLSRLEVALSRVRYKGDERQQHPTWRWSAWTSSNTRVGRRRERRLLRTASKSCAGATPLDHNEFFESPRKLAIISDSHIRWGCNSFPLHPSHACVIQPGRPSPRLWAGNGAIQSSTMEPEPASIWLTNAVREKRNRGDVYH